MKEKKGLQPLKDLLEDVIPRSVSQTEAGAAAPVFNEQVDLLGPTAPAALPLGTLRDAKVAMAKKIRQKNEDEGQHAPDHGSPISPSEVEYINPSLEEELAAVKRAERALAKEREEACLESLEPVAEELIDPASRNAAMKAVLSEQIKHGGSWDPLHVRDDWIHLPHDFVESGEMGMLKDRALRVLLFIKVRASKSTGIAVVNKTEAAKILNLDEKTVQRALDDLRSARYIELVTGGPAVKGHGRRYQVIERLRMVNALPVAPDKETEVRAEFPYKGGGFKSVSEAARAFAKSGDLTKIADHELALVPTKSPYLSDALRALQSGVAIDPRFAGQQVQPSLQQASVVHNITVNVTGDVNAPISIVAGGVVQNSKNQKNLSEINLPDGRGNPLLGALKIVKTREASGGVYEPDE